MSIGKHGIVKRAYSTPDGQHIVVETVNGAITLIPSDEDDDAALSRALYTHAEQKRREAAMEAAYGRALAEPYGADWSKMTQQQRRTTANIGKTMERGIRSGEAPILQTPGEIFAENMMYEAPALPLAPLAPKLSVASLLSNIPRSYSEAVGQRRQMSRYLAKEAPIPYDYDAGVPASWPEKERQRAFFQSLPRQATGTKQTSRPWVDVLGNLPASELGMSPYQWPPKVAGPERPDWYKPPEPEPKVQLQTVPLTARPRPFLSRPLPEMLQELAYGTKRGLGISNLLGP